MAEATFDVFTRVVAGAVWNKLTRGFLVATGTLSLPPDTDSARELVLRSSMNWSTLIPNHKQRYTEKEYCLLSNSALFADVFLCAYRIKGRFNVEAFVKRLLNPWVPSSPLVEYFVLSKIRDNMLWHVDGGMNAGYDMVMYYVLGPSDSVSCFMLLEIDTMQLLQAEVADSSFPTYEQIDAGLIQIDNLKIPLETPDLTGCEATFCGLMRKPELNGLRVNVVKLQDDGKYLVQHGDEQKVVHPRYLQFDPGYCKLPEEISSAVKWLPVDVQRAVQRAVAAGVLRCRFIWAREGDVVVFDGSKPHAVWNVSSVTGRPQLAVAVNYRGVIPHVMAYMKQRSVRLKLSEV